MVSSSHAVTNPDIPMPGPARTGGDSALPMRDVIRLGPDSIHYLAVFDHHTESAAGIDLLGKKQN